MNEGKELRHISYLLLVGMILIFVGMALMFVGVALSGIGGEVSAGGVILIGPIPIILGSGPLGQVLALTAVVITILLLALMFYWSRRRLEGTNA